MKKFILLYVILLCTSCGSFLEQYSQSQTVAKKVEHFDEVLVGDCYMSSVNRSYTGADQAGFLSVMDDDITTVKSDGLAVFYWSGCTQGMFGYYAWQYEVGRNFSGSYLADDSQTWQDFYRKINIVNIILKEIDDLENLTDQEEIDRRRVKGECYFVRGQLYFTLVNLYGKAYNSKTSATDYGVPLKLTEYVEHEKDKKTQFERTPVAKIYEQVVSDLKNSVELLDGNSRGTLHRASKEAAEILLSRVYLYMQDWSNAEKVLSPLVKADARLYHMNENDATKDFLTKDNSEVIFSQGSNNMYNGLTANLGDFAVSQELADLYEANDYRKIFFETNVGTGATALVHKFDGAIIAQVSDLFNIRVSEAYLNIAEAYAMMDNTTEANYYLEKLRANRIKDYVHTNYSGSELVDQIRLERRKELCFEGHRWFDLRRYAVCDKYPFKKSITHDFNVYDSNKNEWINVNVYVLDEDDPAYVMQLPKKVLEYDEVQMPENPRFKRKPTGTDKEDETGEETGD